MIEAKLYIKQNLSLGVKEIVNALNEEVEELFIDSASPLKWTFTEVEQAWTYLTDPEKDHFKDTYDNLIHEGKAENSISITQYCININNGEYKVFLTSYEAYEQLFLTFPK